jgi:hypothetical protein
MVEIRVRGSSQVQVREGDTLTISDYKEGCGARNPKRNDRRENAAVEVVKAKIILV